MALILIGGGSRSGKTKFAIERARAQGPRRAYIATAETLDDEMKARAEAHRSERGPDFLTLEEPLDVAGVVENRGGGFDAVVIDCLTIWLSNLLLAGRDGKREGARLLEAARAAAPAVLCVTNEVGCGIVPDNELARRFRDEAGWLNQRVAEAADEVYWMIFGCAMRVK